MVALLILVLGVAAGVLFLWQPQGAVPPLNPPDSSPNTITPPANLEGLKYLRGDTNILLAVRPREFGTEGSSPEDGAKAALSRLGVPSGFLETFERAGLPWKSVDHVVLGATISDEVAEVPPFTIALVLREPMADEERFLKALQGRRTTMGGRTVHQVNLAGLPGVLAWKAKPSVWILTLREADLPMAEGGSGPTSPTLLDLLTNRLQPEFPVWLVIDEADWSRKPSVKALALLKQKQDWLPRIAKIRALTVGAGLAAVQRQQVVIRTADAETARKVSSEWSEFKPSVQGNDVSIVNLGAPEIILGPLTAGLEKALAP